MGRLDELNIGDKASMKRVASAKVIEDFAEISQDKNPIHLSEDYACNTLFGSRIAHGLFSLSMISCLIGMQLPGKGSILIKDNINYRKPVYLNDEIEATVDIREIDYEKDKILMGILCVNQKGDIVMDGSTVVKVV